MLPRPEVVELLTAATVFVCPSIYEPLGIVNLEAMACETAVVASAVGGIPEVVEDGVTGLLVDYSPDAGRRRSRPAWPTAVNALARDPARARAMGVAGRERAVARVQLGGDRRPDGRALPSVWHARSRTLTAIMA